MADVIFAGSVSAQAITAETVSITITKPDTTTEIITALTLADKTYTVTKQYPAGNYSAKAHIDADGVNTAADSQTVSFTVNLTTRTITLIVNV